MKATFSNHVLTAHTCHAGCVLTLDGCHYVANRPGLIRHLDGLLAFPPPPQPHAPHASLPVDPQVKAAIVCGPPTQGSPGTHSHAPLPVDPQSKAAQAPILVGFAETGAEGLKPCLLSTQATQVQERSLELLEREWKPFCLQVDALMETSLSSMCVRFTKPCYRPCNKARIT